MLPVNGRIASRPIFQSGTIETMKISCPNCNAGGTIPAHVIPDGGLFLNCPRCRHGFTLMNPGDATSAFLVDICPACHYNSFGEARFDICPKCGVIVKAFVERQREEQRLLRERELLEKKHSGNAGAPLPAETTPCVTGIMENMSTVTLVGWGCGLAAAVIFCMGLLGVLDYNSAELKARISAQMDEQVSTLQVFFRFGLMPWLRILYGASAMATVYFFLKGQQMARKALIVLVRIMIIFVPAHLLISFFRWALQPIPHSVAGYFLQLFNLVVMAALFGVPLVLLDLFIRGRKLPACGVRSGN